MRLTATLDDTNLEDLSDATYPLPSPADTTTSICKGMLITQFWCPWSVMVGLLLPAEARLEQQQRIPFVLQHNPTYKLSTPPPQLHPKGHNASDLLSGEARRNLARDEGNSIIVVSLESLQISPRPLPLYHSQSIIRHPTISPRSTASINNTHKSKVYHSESDTSVMHWLTAWQHGEIKCRNLTVYEIHTAKFARRITWIQENSLYTVPRVQRS